MKIICIQDILNCKKGYIVSFNNIMNTALIIGYSKTIIKIKNKENTSIIFTSKDILIYSEKEESLKNFLINKYKNVNIFLIKTNLNFLIENEKYNKYLNTIASFICKQ